MVCEFGSDGDEYTVMGDLLHEDLLHTEIKKIRAHLTPEELMDQIILVYPRQSIVEGLPPPCVGRIQIENAEREDTPQLDSKVWLPLVRGMRAEDCGDGGGVVVVGLVVVECGVAEVGL